MNTRARRRILLGWLPRTVLVLTVLLAPVIDRSGQKVARGGTADEAKERVETVRG